MVTLNLAIANRTEVNLLGMGVVVISKIFFGFGFGCADLPGAVNFHLIIVTMRLTFKYF